MTVAELIVELQKLPAEMPVLISGPDDYYEVSGIERKNFFSSQCRTASGATVKEWWTVGGIGDSVAVEVVLIDC